MAELTVVAATLEHYDDIVALLPGSRGFSCTCQYFRLSSGDYSRSTMDIRTAGLREQLATPPSPGVVAYADGEAIGWCAFAPRTEYERLMRSKTIPIVDDTPVWSIVCFVVKTGHRRQGVSKAMLEAAIDYAEQQGAPALESYPIDTEGERVSTAFLYVGTVRSFEEAGFLRVQETDAKSAHRARWLMRLDLPR